MAVDWKSKVEAAGGTVVQPTKDWRSAVESAGGTFTPSTQNASTAQRNPSVKQELTGLFSRVASDVKTRALNIWDIVGKQTSGPANILDTAGQVAGGVGDVISEGFASAMRLNPMSSSRDREVAAQAFGSLLNKKFNTGLAPGQGASVQDALDEYNKFKEKFPDAARHLESVGNIASLLPLEKAPGLIADAIETATKPAIKTAAGLAGDATNMSADAVAASGRLAKGAGEATVQSAITPNVAEAERILSYEAKTPFLTRVSETASGVVNDAKPVTRATTATEKGLVGTEKMVGVQARREADKLWKETIAPAVKESKEVITKEDLFKPIQERIAATTEPGKRASYQDAFDGILEDYKDISSFTLEEAQKLKRELDQFTPEKIFRGKNVANEYTTLKNDMANAIRNKTYEVLSDQNIRKAYLDWGNLSELQKVGVKAISGATNKGGFGGFWTGIWDAATTPIKTVGGQVLYRVGDKLEFLGEKGLTKFGDFLKSKGYDRPML